MEEFQPEVVKMVLDMDISAMEEAWKEIQTKKYSLASFNCSDAVLEVLEAGNYKFRMNRGAFSLTSLSNPNPELKMIQAMFHKKVGELLLTIYSFKTSGFFSAVTRFTKNRN